jgi:uncharacterized membrane-anchored protein YjiN (DUF445 family)
LADWFAVTALFSHPLGLPILHTAIVKIEQKRIGLAVAFLIRRCFLIQEKVIRQWMAWRPARQIAKHLARRENVAKRSKWMVSRISDLMKKLDRENLDRLGALDILSMRKLRNLFLICVPSLTGHLSAFVS